MVRGGLQNYYYYYYYMVCKIKPGVWVVEVLLCICICICRDALEGLLGHEERAYINLSCSWCRYIVFLVTVLVS